MENVINMTYAPVTDVLSGKLAVDSEVTVRGWIRSRRDSKAGISFLAIYDGSCFDPIQAVVPNDLNNYNEEVLKLTTGCSVEVTGTIVASPAKGQDFELAATAVKVVGLVEDPDTYPMAKTRSLHDALPISQWRKLVTLLSIYEKLLTFAHVLT